MHADDKGGPSWDRLFELAACQDGLFTTQQAAGAGYSSQLLDHHVRSGNIVRVRRGVYRLVHFPMGEHEDLAVAWLWSEQAGIVSHQSALSLSGLSDILPAHIHLTLPLASRPRRLRAPPDVVVHHAEVAAEDRTWFGAVPMTKPGRSLNDCANAGLSPEHLQRAAAQAIHRGLVARNELSAVDVALAPFGGLVA